jgi:hypothetical protein
MTFKSLVLAIAFSVSSSVSASAVEVPGTLKPIFDADIHLLRGAIGKHGEIDMKKLVVSVHARRKVPFTTVYATLETFAGGKWQLLGSLGCGVGPLEKGQSSIYEGHSCDPKPVNIFKPRGRALWASLTVKSTNSDTGAVVVQTGTVRVRVHTYPPGMKFK